MACRRCHRAQHLTDYPSRARTKAFARLVTSLWHGEIDDAIDTRELEALVAPKRRGVWRGRRVQQRAMREVLKFSRRLTDARALFADYRV